MTDHCRFPNPPTDRIRTLNDAFRTSLTGGSVEIIIAPQRREDLALDLFPERRNRSRDHDADNDPYGEHDFGRITVQGHEILFKIDYYDRDLVRHSPDPSDPAVTHRVLTVMLAEDY